MSFELIPQGKVIKDFADEVTKYWEDSKVFEKIENQRKGGNSFIFLEGPPTANGRPHVGHALTRTIKDTALRYKNNAWIQYPEKGCRMGLPRSSC